MAVTARALQEGAHVLGADARGAPHADDGDDPGAGESVQVAEGNPKGLGRLGPCPKRLGRREGRRCRLLAVADEGDHAFDEVTKGSSELLVGGLRRGRQRAPLL